MITHLIAFVVANYIKFVIGYVVIGVGYTFLKWVLTLYKLRRWVLADRDKFRYLDNLGNFTANNGRDRWLTGLANSLLGGYQSYPPRAKDNLGNLSTWGFFWPINLPYTLLADVIKELFNWLYELLGEVYNSIARAILPE